MTELIYDFTCLVSWKLFLSFLCSHINPEHFAYWVAWLVVFCASLSSSWQPFHTEPIFNVININKFFKILDSWIKHIFQNVTFVTVFNSFHRIFADFETLMEFLCMFLNKTHLILIQFKLFTLDFLLLDQDFLSLFPQKIQNFLFFHFLNRWCAKSKYLKG